MIVITYNLGVINIKLPARTGEIDRDPIILRDYNETYKLIVDLCEALIRAWPNADLQGVDR